MTEWLRRLWPTAERPQTGPGDYGVRFASQPENVPPPPLPGVGQPGPAMQRAFPDGIAAALPAWTQTRAPAPDTPTPAATPASLAAALPAMGRTPTKITSLLDGRGSVADMDPNAIQQAIAAVRPQGQQQAQGQQGQQGQSMNLAQLLMIQKLQQAPRSGKDEAAGLAYNLVQRQLNDTLAAAKRLPAQQQQDAINAARANALRELLQLVSPAGIMPGMIASPTVR
jgi:hypothetical protein